MYIFEERGRGLTSSWNQAKLGASSWEHSRLEHTHVALSHTAIISLLFLLPLHFHIPPNNHTSILYCIAWFNFRDHASFSTPKKKTSHFLIVKIFIYQLDIKQTSYAYKLKWSSTSKSIGNGRSNSQPYIDAQALEFYQCETNSTFILQH